MFRILAYRYFVTHGSSVALLPQTPRPPASSSTRHPEDPKTLPKSPQMAIETGATPPRARGLETSSADYCYEQLIGSQSAAPDSRRLNCTSRFAPVTATCQLSTFNDPFARVRTQTPPRLPHNSKRPRVQANPRRPHHLEAFLTNALPIASPTLTGTAFPMSLPRRENTAFSPSFKNS